MYNKKVLNKATANLDKAKAPAKKKDIIVDPMGQWKYPGENTRIPGGNITMQGVSYPVLAEPNVGQPQMMYPGMEYQFPGADYVDEYPQMKKGGLKKNKTSRSLMATNKLFAKHTFFKKPGKNTIYDPNSSNYQDGGEYIETELTDAEIEEYRKGGYIVEDISIPSVGDYKKGGSLLTKYLQEGGTADNYFTYSGRPGATYQKVNNQWYIHTEHTNGEFIPVKDPTGKRTALLNSQAKPMATTTNKYQRTYDPLLDNKPQVGETTQKVAQDFMMAKDSKQYAEKSMEAQARAQAEKSPEQIANEATASSLKNSLTPEEKALAKEYFNNPDYNYYHDPIRGVREGNVTEAQSFMERMDELAWPAFQPFTGNPSFEKTKLQEFEKNKVKKFQTLDDAMRAVYAERVANNRGQTQTSLTPSEEVQRNQAMQQYQTPPGQMASGRAAPVDWLWAAPIAGPAALEMLGGLGAMSLPGMSAVPGATMGNLVNSGFIANSLMQAPSNVKSWYDVSQGKKSSQEAMLESAEIAAGMIGSGAGLKSLAQDAKQVGKYLTTETALKDAYKLNPLAPKLGKYNRVVGEDAITDLQNSGLVRAGNYGGVKQQVGSINATRTTPYPSFGAGNPRNAYLEQTIAQGKTPYIISTNRTMEASKLGRHGKGSTMFPVDASGNYMQSFPASEAQVFEGTPNWLKGYKKVPNKSLSLSKNVPDLNVKLLPDDIRSKELDMETFGIYKGDQRVGEVSGNRLSNGDFETMDIGVDPKFQKQGIGTETYRQLNESLPEGNKVRSWGAFVEENGVAPGRNTWQSLERQGLAKKNEKGIYEMTPNTSSNSNEAVKAGFDGNFITRPLTPFGKNELTPGNQWYRQIGNEAGLRDLIKKEGGQAPAPMRMKSGLTLDAPFFGRGSAPNKKNNDSYSTYQKGGKLGPIHLNEGRKTLRDYVYGADIGMMQEQFGGSTDAELTDEEIQAYRDAGYYVEELD